MHLRIFIPSTVQHYLTALNETGYFGSEDVVIVAESDAIDILIFLPLSSMSARTFM